MKIFMSLAFASVLLLQGCATVEIATNNESKVEAPAQTADRLKLRKVARFMVSKFEKMSWVPKQSSQEKQSAMSVLLSGIKKVDRKENHVEVYLKTVSNKESIISDIQEARRLVEETQSQALSFLNENPDVNNLKTDLHTLETALLACIKSEETFKSALEAKLIKTAEGELETYGASIEGLRAVTDAFGQRQRRGQNASSATG